MAPTTRIMKIGALLLSQFGLLAALNFQLFGMVAAYKMMELKQNLSLAAYLSARKTNLQRKRRYLQARRVHGFPNSLVLFNLICIEVDVLTLYLSFEIRETMNTILYFIALIPLKSLLLPSGSHIVSCFSARAEIPFRLHEIFSVFLARLPGLKILARFTKTGLGFSALAELCPGLNSSPCNRQFDFKRICFRSRAEVSTPSTGLKFAM